MQPSDFLKTFQETRQIAELFVEQQAAAAKAFAERFGEIQTQAAAAKVCDCYQLLYGDPEQ